MPTSGDIKMATTQNPAPAPVNAEGAGTKIATPAKKAANPKNGDRKQYDDDELIKGADASQTMPPENVVEVTGSADSGNAGALGAAAAAAAALAAGGGGAAAGQAGTGGADLGTPQSDNNGGAAGAAGTGAGAAGIPSGSVVDVAGASAGAGGGAGAGAAGGLGG